jgi:hypothetical protein
LKASCDHTRPHSGGRGATKFASPAKTHSSPLRESSPPRHNCSPAREHHESHPYPRLSPSRKPILHLHEEDQLVNSLREMI